MHAHVRRVRLLAVTVSIAVLAACHYAPTQQIVAPELKLIGSEPLLLPRDCLMSGSFAVAFTVDTSGRTDAIRAPDAPSCAHDALVAWVASFRYEPPARPTAATLEWMLVTGKRGS